MQKVLLSAYACEPDKGSEPGVGWKWANGLARNCRLAVLTRESNRKAIERAAALVSASDPLRSVRFIYHDLGPFWLWAKRLGLLPTFAYYVMWQWSVARKFHDLAESHDVVHHLTFCSLLCPGYWKLKSARFIIGPVGAPLVRREYFGLFGFVGGLVQRLRGCVMRRYHALPWLDRLLARAEVIVPANSDTKTLLDVPGRYRIRDVILDTGAPDSAPAAIGSADGKVRFVYAGRLERRKGLELVLAALAKLPAHGPDWEFLALGDGPDRLRLQILAGKLGLKDKVVFAGAKPRSEVWNTMRVCDVFVFCSVRDTSGGVNLEAMSMGLPVVCLAHQGVGDITDVSCAMRVPPGDVQGTVGGLTGALGSIKDDEALRRRLGENARIRALEKFSWEDKFRRMVAIYEEAVAAPPFADR